ncbi:NusG domain II-containing protein [Clostridium frigoris]|uniref:NusG domain II-containing protein n=1 Tax=Clostridium frigoris TaxID=205327 RepID=A0ABS6BU71_9CLOT|nr:NusG domain II-containing protein [Clostridium frigoris]MBU3160357.1 NusG domain II-containing protein [Clostridium frigoris]
MKTKWDKIIIGGLLIICLISTFFVYITENTGNANKKAVIKVQGKIIKEIPLPNNEKSKIYKFNFNGNNGYLEVKNGSVRMLEMDIKICPKKICSTTGWINKKYKVIVCLPNKIAVNIESTKDDTLDAISN